MKKVNLVLVIVLLGITSLKAQYWEDSVYSIQNDNASLRFLFPPEGELESCEPLRMNAIGMSGFYFEKPIISPKIHGGNIEFNTMYSTCPSLYLGNIEFKVNSVPKLTVRGTDGCVIVNHTTTGDWNYAFHIRVDNDLTKALSVRNVNTNQDVFLVYGNGVMCAKKIFTEKIEVTLSALSYYWYDHVFAQDYKLMSLPELEMFIKTNKHLPEIPSEKEVMENGLDLGEISGKLLLKIEELTLYIIEQEKQMKEMQKRLSELEAKKGSE
ncbi:MAG: hypothetical protein FWH36_00030 [Lentimicrobiaceae bacterium]|nr:hypothetical protein [Lentimicrobiaceae bacterium]